MSGIGGSEFLLLCLIGLLILGPERLPRVARQLGGWVGKARKITRGFQRQLEEGLDRHALGQPHRRCRLDRQGHEQPGEHADEEAGAAVEYIDLGEAAGLNICQLGALQISAAYEKLIDRGIQGSVIYAPSDEIYEAAKTMIATFVSVGGELPHGYRLTRTPLAIKDVPAYLLGDHLQEPRLVA